MHIKYTPDANPFEVRPEVPTDSLLDNERIGRYLPEEDADDQEVAPIQEADPFGSIEKYNTFIVNELSSAGFEIPENEKQAIFEEIQTIKAENPSFFGRIEYAVEAHEKLPAEIQKLEIQVAELGHDEHLKEKMVHLETSRTDLQELKQFLKPTGQLTYALKLVWAAVQEGASFLCRQMGVETAQAGSYIKEVDSTLNKYMQYKKEYTNGKPMTEIDRFDAELEVDDRIRGVASHIKDLALWKDKIELLKKVKIEDLGIKRDALVEAALGMKSVSTYLKNSIESEFEQLMTVNSISSFEEVCDRMGKLDKLQQQEGLNIINERDLEYMKEIAQIKLEDAIQKEIATVLHTRPIAPGSLSRLQQELDPILKRTEIGSKKDVEVREFLFNCLKNCEAELDNSVEGKMRRLTVKAIMSEFRLKNYHATT